MSASPREAYEGLLAYLRETATLESCAGVLGWDQETCMPPGAVSLRAEHLALLRGLIHRRDSAAEFREKIEAAARLPEAALDGTAEAANVREARHAHDRATKLPTDLVEEIARVTTLARRTWTDAKHKRQFALFQPSLEKIVELTRRVAECYGYRDHPYDALLDDYERGETTAGLQRLFRPLRDGLTDLLDRILGSSRRIDTSMLQRHYPRAKQAEFARLGAETIGFDFARGRLDVAEHPFCSGIGTSDVRLTTRYDEHYFPQAFFGVLHEAGHGIYEQGFDPAARGTPMGRAASFGVHESQSRLWENVIGRSRPFWRHFFPLAQEAFPDALGHEARDDFLRAINEVKPSFVRTEADEVTYNLHIFLRFELEQALVGGSLSVADLPAAWNEIFERDFRMKVPDDAQGCLQDIHWSSGSFGYFPTYTLGNLYAAQLWRAARKELGDPDTAFAAGDFRGLKEWLAGRVHRHGSRWLPRTLIEKATGEPLSPQPLIEFLQGKYIEVYGI